MSETISYPLCLLVLTETWIV